MKRFFPLLLFTFLIGSVGFQFFQQLSPLFEKGGDYLPLKVKSSTTPFLVQVVSYRAQIKAKDLKDILWGLGFKGGFIREGENFFAPDTELTPLPGFYKQRIQLKIFPAQGFSSAYQFPLKGVGRFNSFRKETFNPTIFTYSGILKRVMGGVGIGVKLLGPWKFESITDTPAHFHFRPEWLFQSDIPRGGSYTLPYLTLKSLTFDLFQKYNRFFISFQPVSNSFPQFHPPPEGVKTRFFLPEEMEKKGIPFPQKETLLEAIWMIENIPQFINRYYDTLTDGTKLQQDLLTRDFRNFLTLFRAGLEKLNEGP